MIYGKDNRKGITSIQVGDNDETRLYYYNGRTEDVPTDLFILWSRRLSEKHMRMHGNQEYNWATKYKTKRSWEDVKRNAQRRRYDFMTPWNAVENSMIKSGYNNFKDITVEQIPTLSFDIEATTLDPSHANAKVLIISNTFRDGKGGVIKKLFSYDEYLTDKDMIKDWCSWVRLMNPRFIIGHNIYGYDLPYLNACGDGLKLGAEGQKAVFSQRTREFRKDGSQSYSYHNVNIDGREIIDTFFLAIKYDIGRKYPSYGLKPIIEFEGLEVEGRQHYDASLIAKNYRDKEEFRKIKEYAKDDADDSLRLFDLMVPAFFYYARHIPKSFQEIINSATGAQLNSLMVRSYIEKKHSIPKATSANGYEGAISFGIPGVYENVLSVDFHALYPSIIRQYKVYDEQKDPEAHLLQMTEAFASMRVEYKNKYKETKDEKYNGMQLAAKVAVNSIYGFLGAPGLHFNSPRNAALVTRKGRELLNKICIGATKRDIQSWKDGVK